MKRTLANLIRLLLAEFPLLLKRGIWYIVIGLCAFGVDYVVFMLGAKTYGLPVHVANFISACHGMAVSFTGNMLFNFKVRDKMWQRFGRFLLTNALGYAISTAVIMTMLEMQDSLHIAKLTSVVFSVAAMFWINYTWTYRGHRFPPPQGEG